MTTTQKPSRIFLLSLGIVSLTLTVSAFDATATQQDPPPDDAGQDMREAMDELQDATTQPLDTNNATDEARGMAALAEARAHMDAGRYQQALDAYRTALQAMPDNQEARAGEASALARLDQASGLDQAATVLTLRGQQVRAEFDAAVANARQLLEQQQFGQAETVVTTARVNLNNNQRFISGPEHTQRLQAAGALLAEIGKAKELHMADIIRQQTIDRGRIEEENRRREAEQREATINQNLTRVRALQLDRNYDEAMQVIDQILFLDEDNPAALALRDAIQTAALWQNFLSGERAREFSFTYQFEENRRAAIAPRPNYGPGEKSTTGLMTYPEDWPNLSIRRTSDAGFVDTDANRRVAMAIEQDMPRADYQGHQLHQVLAHIGSFTNINLHVDWQALEYLGIHPTDAVTLNLVDVPVRTVVERVLGQLGDGTMDHPVYAIQDGLLVISSQEEIRKHVVTLVYDISDLLFDVPYFDNAPSLDLDKEVRNNNAATAMQNAGAFHGLGASRSTQAATDLESSGGFQKANPRLFNGNGNDPDAPTRGQKIEKIVNAVQAVVDPEGWRDFGGDTGALQELSGNLIITQTPRNHQQIEGLLSQLREIRALQINIESRFLTVDMNWFEKIGFDLDLYFNTNSSTFQAARAVDPNFHLSDFFDGRGRLKDPVIFDSFSRTNPDANTIGTGYLFGIPTGGPPPTDITYVTGPVGTPIRSTDGFSPIGLKQDSLNLANLLGNFAGDSFGGQILASNPALGLGIQFLDDVQVDLLIEATQADRRNVLLTAPRLSLFNGQRSWVLVGTQQTYISSLIPVIGDNSGAFQAIPAVLTDGTVLDVEAVVSADRRYVTMTIITGIRETINLDTFVVQGAVGGGGGIGGGNGAVFEGIVTLPEVEVVLINTTTSIPDRGTILLGGQRLVREVEIETGVPIFSKIPLLNRFFTNRITSKDESTLLILVRPEIIIQQENEDLLFPGLSDMLGTR
ncbi:MAG: hypothetical protein ACR2GY_08615 [Phycisphaerales bacterium]